MIKKIDFVGYTPKVYFSEQTKFGTVLGGFFTIILLVLTILATIGFGRDIIERKNPTVLTSNTFIEPSLNLDQGIAIGYRLFYTGGKLIPDLDRLVDIFVLHSVFRPDLSAAQVTRYETIKCREAEIYKANVLNITSLMGNPDDYYCVPNNITFALMGKYGAPINNHMHLRIGICKNSTLNNNRCFPDSVIRQKLASFFVSFLYKDSYIDSKDFEDPVKYYLTSNTLKSSSNNFRQDAYLYKNVSFSSDSGLIMPDSKDSNHVQLDTIMSSTSGDTNTDVFTNVIVGLTNIKMNYHRNYIKIQDVSAQVGGILKFFLLIVDSLLSFYSFVPFLESLYSKLFDYELLKDTVRPPSSLLISKSNINLHNFSQDKLHINNYDESNYNAAINNKFSMNELNRQKTRGRLRPSKYNIFETLFRCCRKNKNSHKYNYLNKITRHYETSFDVMELILNIQKTSLVFDYNFNEREKEILNLHRINCFFTENSEKYQEANSGDPNASNVSSSPIFDRLKISRNLMPTRKGN